MLRTTLPKVLIGIACASLGPSLICAKGEPAFTTVEEASKDADFSVQGEYVGNGSGLQVTALGKGAFRISTYVGGLPGAGWDGGKIGRSEGDAALVQKAVAGFKRVERKSPTLNEKAPQGAVVLFTEGGAADAWAGGKTEHGLLVEGTASKAKFGDFKLHLEFRLPYKPEAPVGSQDRGNSGLYLFNRYECQILDSFGNDYDESTWPEGKAPSLPTQWCGSFYKTKTPDLPMCLPPLAWQTYDIDFTAPRFGDDGKKTANARVTVRLNGVVIHDDFELEKGTGAGGKRPEIAEGQIHLQGHGNPIRFRNIWVVEK